MLDRKQLCSPVRQNGAKGALMWHTSYSVTDSVTTALINSTQKHALLVY